MGFRASRNHKKVVGFATPGRLATSRNARPPSTRSYTLTPPPCVPPSTIQRPSSPKIAAARRCLRPVCTSATNSGASGFSSEKIASVSPSGLGSSLFDAYRNCGPPPVSAGASSSSAATSSLSGSSGGRWRVDVVLRRVGSAGSGGRWCVVSVFVSSFSVYRMSSVCRVRELRPVDEKRTVKDYVPRPAAWSVHHFTFHDELARWLPHDAPCPVATEIGNQEFGPSGDGHDLVRVRALLTLQVGARTFELEQRGLGVLREVWRRGRHWSDQDGSR